MINKQVLRKIQSGEEKEWYAAVTDAALYMATGGFLKEANELLQALWQNNLDHDRTTWMADNAFEVLWYAANNRPVFVPFNKTEIDELEFEFRKYCTMVNSISDTDITELLSGLDLTALGLGNIDLTSAILPERDALNQSPSFLAAIKNGKMPSAAMELKSLAGLEIQLKDAANMANWEFGDTASLAAELSAKNNQPDKAIQIVKLWAGNYHSRYLGINFSKMACSRHIAPLLLKGIIAEELNLTKEKCDSFVKDAATLINERVKNGIALAYGNLTWKEILKKLSTLSIKHEPDQFTEMQQKENWIGLPPATIDEIKNTETKLGITLPKDYKDFLLVSNGLPEFPMVNPALLQVEQVDRLENIYSREYEDDILDIIKEYPDEKNGTIAIYVESAICISQHPAEQEIWLIPPGVKNKEWETWFFAPWSPGETRYKSFRYFIEKCIQELDSY